MKIKTTMIGFGSVIAIAAPVVAVVSCGSSDDHTTTNEQKFIDEITKLKGMVHTMADKGSNYTFHFVMKSLEPIAKASKVDATQSAELNFYYDKNAGNGVGYHISKNADFAVPFLEQTGVWLLPQSTDKTSGTKLTSAKQKMATEQELTAILDGIIKAIKDKKLAVTAGDKIIVNHSKHDTNKHVSTWPEVNDRLKVNPNDKDEFEFTLS